MALSLEHENDRCKERKKKGKKAEMVYNEMLKENQILAAVILQNL
jgi:hypothetical protein